MKLQSRVILGSGPNAGLVATNNAFWLEPKGDGTSLRAYFMTKTTTRRSC